MRWTSRIAAAALVAVLQACATPPAQTPPPPAAALDTRQPVTILVSIDGFRSDYLQRGVTPNLLRLAAQGITGQMRPSFPSKTFPNHWTLVTGVVPDHHGIVGNRMEDPAHPGQTFTTASDAPYWWNAAQPIWVAAEKAGVRTGTVFWPGANIAWGSTATRADHGDYPGGTRPEDWLQYSQAVSDTQRVNTVLDWLRRPATIRPRFVTLYFDRVDSVGHDHGPNSTQVTQAAGEIDAQIGALVAGLAALHQPANLVIVSDHGMSEASDTRLIPLGLPKDSYHLIEAGPFAALDPLPGKEALVEKTLLGRHPHMECWRKAEIPARFRYGSNPRIAAIFCLADPRWMIVETLPEAPFTRGEHGYDNRSADMAALFIAAGPAFRHGSVPAFDNVDIYPLLRDLLGLPPRHDVDGDDAPFQGLLRPRRNRLPEAGFPLKLVAMRMFDDIQVGDRARFGRYEVTRDEVLDFARKYDPQPFHLSDEAAAATHFGRLAASGWHTNAMTMAMLVAHYQEHPIASLGAAGIDELRWLKPVYPGDVLRCETEVLEARASQSRPEMGIVRSRMTTFNQKDEPVLTFIANALIARRTAA